MTGIAQIYWRTVQRGTRAFASVPLNVRPDVQALARQDVASGALTAEQYQQYIGQPYYTVAAEESL